MNEDVYEFVSSLSEKQAKDLLTEIMVYCNKRSETMCHNSEQYKYEHMADGANRVKGHVIDLAVKMSKRGYV